MKRGTAASYCDLTPIEFEREVAAGRIHLPVQIGNADHWSRTKLEDDIANIMGEGKKDWRRQQPAYAA